MNDSSKRVRLDKWLWAARFYKTRSIAKQAIEGGKVHYNGARCKVSKEVELGALLTLRTGWDEREVEVLALSDQRRGAPEAALLYRETDDSISQRERRAAERKALGPAAGIISNERPTKKQRRQIHRFREQQD
ncbi:MULTISPECIES: ribosome-associated heat shock protein Hsp15 [Spongiibacter]|uniref:ribosome-associated heat shock protein Hsp15 n=1 Tax=Spongiibacter TaxID=630749 RepID=UPI0003B7BB54|nr:MULTISPECIES: ribosome-associated heat shock protein Hsp15 [Spongiibacter]MAY38714.1 RNA-binding protein [Spongiibacter sp.]MBI57172.1 RNA-binding protein [Spongiibacter sp.]MBO6752846.1 ribosome-associated heat shock protein Hsp15 [Spongiibacter sp.]MBU73525.1 RNA-binding protein [Spongiibacter sp.]